MISMVSLEKNENSSGFQGLIQQNKWNNISTKFLNLYE